MKKMKCGFNSALLTLNSELCIAYERSDTP